MSSPLTLLTRSNGCPNCLNVKSIFKALGLDYKEIDVDKNAEEAAPLLAKATSRSLPLMFDRDEKNVAAGLKCIEEARRYAN